MRRTGSKRHIITVLFWSVLWGMALAKLYSVYRQRDFLLKMSHARIKRVSIDTPRRGNILADDGSILAFSEPSWSLVVNPKLYTHDEKTTRTIASIAGLPWRQLAKQLRDVSSKRFYMVKRFVTENNSLYPELEKIVGVYWKSDYKRSQSNEDSMQYFMGKTDTEDKGVSGIEKAFEAQLSGENGVQLHLVSPSGDVIEVLEKTAKRDGQDVGLSINPCLQHHAYQAVKTAVTKHKAMRGAALVVDVATGAIKAIAHVGKGRQAHSAWALVDTQEPGSMIKPLILGYVLDHSKFNVDSLIDTGQGVWTLHQHKITDVKSYGKLSVTDILAKSSNIGMAKLLTQTPAGIEQWLWSSLKIFDKTGLHFSGEAKGFMINKPNSFEHATLSYGYGLNVSLMQLARAYLVLANGGFYQDLCWHNCGVSKEERTRVISKNTHKALVAMLKKAVAGDGTGMLARVKGVTVAGKTGTTHKLKDGVYRDSYTAGFAGFAPAEQPRWVVVVSIDEPTGATHFGGQVASPVFSEVVQAALYQCKV